MPFRPNTRSLSAETTPMHEGVMRRLEVHYSALALIGGAALCGGGGLALFFFAGLMPRPNWLSGAFYVLATIGFAVAVTYSFRLLTARGRVVVSIDATGFKDTRLTPTAIPWSAIRSVSPYILYKQTTPTGVALVIDPALKRSLSIRLGARLFNWANLNFGSIVYVDMRTLDADSDQVARAAEPYVLNRAGPSANA
jgi:hypothetical protein